jgi:hypothetical protein
MHYLDTLKLILTLDQNLTYNGSYADQKEELNEFLESDNNFDL